MGLAAKLPHKSRMIESDPARDRKKDRKSLFLRGMLTKAVPVRVSATVGLYALLWITSSTYRKLSLL